MKLLRWIKKFFLFCYYRGKYWPKIWDQRAIMEYSAKELHKCRGLGLTHPEIRDAVKQILDLKLGELVLDIGCGGGGGLKLCDEEKVPAVGIDFSYEMARLTKNAIHYPILNADIRYLPFRHGVFQKIICHSVLHYVPSKDIELALREMVRVLSPGGLIFIGDLPKKGAKRNWWGFQTIFFAREELENLARRVSKRIEFVNLNRDTLDFILK